MCTIVCECYGGIWLYFAVYLGLFMSRFSSRYAEEPKEREKYGEGRPVNRYAAEGRMGLVQRSSLDGRALMWGIH